LRQALLGLWRLAPDDPRRLLVGRSRPHLHQLVDGPELIIADVLVEPAVVAARVAEQLVERGIGERFGHAGKFLET
jgi:hypothetical protein